ncbi:D(1B) dopamine receptor [Clupea harengus]|uniref:D(1B) dopamine receptor n=1 Tax=Clupea harengus TaxID=7950 RepID=A0A6P3W141_CLUHA|nr:D(1B) dopamine receptor [Clupea harengus]
MANNTGRTTGRDEFPTRMLMGCVFLLLILWTLFGNFTVCAAVLRFRHLRVKVTNIFIVSLAFSDLLVAVLVMPWKAVADVLGHWPFGTFCNTWVAFDIMCSTASILNLCAISLDRYWAISSPFRYERKMNKKLALIMVSITWTVSGVISFVPVQLNWHKAEQETTVVSNQTVDNCDSSLSKTYAIWSSLISFYIPVAIMIVTYTKIYQIAHLQILKISSLERAAEHAVNCRSSVYPCPHQKTLKLSKETKLLKTLSIIMGVFVCCWFPFFVVNCAVPFCHEPQNDEPKCVSDTTFEVFMWFGWCNSSLNPIIYAFNADFREAFTRLLNCCGVCGKAPSGTFDVSQPASNNQNSSMGVAYVNMGLDNQPP